MQKPKLVITKVAFKSAMSRQYLSTLGAILGLSIIICKSIDMQGPRQRVVWVVN